MARFIIYSLLGLFSIGLYFGFVNGMIPYFLETQKVVWSTHIKDLNCNLPLKEEGGLPELYQLK